MNETKRVVLIRFVSLTDGVENALRGRQCAEFVDEPVLLEQRGNAGKEIEMLPHVVRRTEKQHVHADGISAVMRIGHAGGTNTDCRLNFGESLQARVRKGQSRSDDGGTHFLPRSDGFY